MGAGSVVRKDKPPLHVGGPAIQLGSFAGLKEQCAKPHSSGMNVDWRGVIRGRSDARERERERELSHTLWTNDDILILFYQYLAACLCGTLCVHTSHAEMRLDPWTLKVGP